MIDQPRSACVIVPYPSSSGAEMRDHLISVREIAIAELLQDRGFSVVGLRCTRGTEPVRLSVTSPQWISFPVDDPSLPDNAVCSVGIEAAVDSAKPDLVIVHGAGTAIGESIRRRTQCFEIVLIGGRYRTSSLTQADWVFLEKQDQARYLRYRIGRNRLHPMPKLVDPILMAHPLSIERDIDVLSIGKLEPHKNHQLLRGLFDMPVSIVLAGDGSLRSELESLALGARADVRFVGQQRRDEIFDLLTRSKILAHPSLSEGFPRAVAEALAAGTPPVALADVVGLPVIHENNGLLVDAEHYCRSILDLLHDEPRLADMRIQARRTAIATFGLDRLSQTVNLMAGEAQTAFASDRKPRRFMKAAKVRRSLWDLSTYSASHVRSLFNHFSVRS